MLFSALLHSFAYLHKRFLRTFAPGPCAFFCALLHPTVFRTTMFGNFRAWSPLFEHMPLIHMLRPCWHVPRFWKLLPEVFLGILLCQNMHNIFHHGRQPDFGGQFSVGCWVQDQLGENYLIYCNFLESQHTLGRKYALHI